MTSFSISRLATAWSTSRTAVTLAIVLSLGSAAVGHAGTFSLTAQSAGWYRIDSFHMAGSVNYVTGDLGFQSGVGSKVFRSFFIFDLSSLTLAPGEILSTAALVIPTAGVTTNDPSETVTFFDVTTPASALDPTSSVGSAAGQLIYADLGQGAQYGSRSYANSDSGGTSSVDLNPSALAAITAAIGGPFAIGGALTTLDGADNLEIVYGGSDFVGSSIRLDVTTVPEPGTASLAVLAACFLGSALIPRAGATPRVTRRKLRAPRGLRLLLIFLSAGFGAAHANPASAAEFKVRIQGEVISVADDLNWFNDSIQIGMPVEGAYNFFDPGYLKGIIFGDPSEITYEYLLVPNMDFNVPVLPVRMRLSLGGHDYDTAGPSPVPYAINVYNDSSGFVSGDAYQVQSPLPFPSHFTDWTGDPVNDPDGFFYPYLFMTLDLRDLTGTAFSSTDLPLVPPALGGFASALGHIYIADGNGEPNYAEVAFRITSLQAVPEPSSIAICGVGLVLAVRGVNRRRGFKS